MYVKVACLHICKTLILQSAMSLALKGIYNLITTVKLLVQRRSSSILTYKSVSIAQIFLEMKVAALVINLRTPF